MVYFCLVNHRVVFKKAHAEEWLDTINKRVDCQLWDSKCYPTFISITYRLKIVCHNKGCLRQKKNKFLKILQWNGLKKKEG